MTAGPAPAERGRSRRRQRLVSIAGVVAIVGSFLVTAGATAHALSPCTGSDPYCPVANVDTYSVPFGQKLVVSAADGLLKNDHGPASTHVNTAAGETDTESWNGAKIAVKSDGSFTYTPLLSDPNLLFSGQDSFNYTIAIPSDSEADFNEVDINVIPVVRNDSYSMQVNQPLTVLQPGLLANDGGIDPDSLVLDTTSANGGTITDGTDGAFTYTPAPGFQGTDTFHYVGNDLDFDPDPYTGTVTIYIDGTPPIAGMSAPGLVTLNTKVPAAWSGSDVGGTGVATYDAQYQIAPWNAPFGAWAWLKIGTVSTSDVVAGTYGRTFCFRVRARDHAGNYSAFTVPRCSAVPLRAASLVYSKLWARVKNAAFFAGEAFTTINKGQTIVRTGLQTKRMWLVATKCASCGSLQIRWNNVVIGNVSLVSPVTAHHVLIPIASFPTAKAGTLSMYVTSANGRHVTVEGLAALRV